MGREPNLARSCGRLIGAALGIVANWVKPPPWAEDHPLRVVALVVVLAVGGALIAAAAGALANSSSGQNSAAPTTTSAPAPTTTPAITATRDPVVTPAGPPPVVTTTTRTTTSAPPPRSPVPAQLVGSWGGGSTGSTAGRSYTFGRDGDVLYRRGTEDVQGTVVIRGSVLTMYFPGVAPQKYRWSVESYEVSGYAFSNLYLDGFTYVRQDSP